MNKFVKQLLYFRLPLLLSAIDLWFHSKTGSIFRRKIYVGTEPRPKLYIALYEWARKVVGL